MSEQLFGTLLCDFADVHHKLEKTLQALATSTTESQSTTAAANSQSAFRIRFRALLNPAEILQHVSAAHALEAHLPFDIYVCPSCLQPVGIVRQAHGACFRHLAASEFQCCWRRSRRTSCKRQKTASRQQASRRRKTALSIGSIRRRIELSQLHATLSSVSFRLDAIKKQSTNYRELLAELDADALDAARLRQDIRDLLQTLRDYSTKLFCRHADGRLLLSRDELAAAAQACFSGDVTAILLNRAYEALLTKTPASAAERR